MTINEVNKAKSANAKYARLISSVKQDASMTERLKFIKTFKDQCEAIDLCVKQNYVLPSLCLIYCGIDAAAWVAFGDISVKKRFCDFVSTYMYKEKELAPEPIDLYAARCAVLHTMTPDSGLSYKNQAVPLNYAWGTASLEELKKSTEEIRPGEMSYVHLSDLAQSFKLGLARFAENDANKQDCKDRMKKYYAGLSKEIISEFNKLNL